MSSTCTLEVHSDGWLYIKEVLVSAQEPVKHTSWWPTGWRVHAFTRQYGTNDLGKPVHVPIHAFPFRYQTERGLIILLKDGPQTTTTYFEQNAIPCPALKGKQKGLPTRWIGYWQIQTKKGWRAL